MSRPFAQVDVFTAEPYGGNPVAVVLDAEGLSTEQMQRFARWTNLSETTFVLPSDVADYRVRIFTPTRELPFAGHPTLGTCHAWLEAGGRGGDAIVQECEAGRIDVRRTDGGLAFAAPPLIRSGPVEEPVLAHVAALLGIARDAMVDAAWADNGPGWVAVLLRDADAVLALRPGVVDLDIGVAGFAADGTLEVRAFFPPANEDPVTGSLNASLAQWLLETGRISAPYVARQTSGRVHVSVADGEIWVGGATVTRVAGTVAL
ncbi:MAG TPA: PhzF family phenazine biosynthesis protein [Solirubrobacter sp.]|nr:PhzF family phenazine biosynthesis protein [Solirubrobacter sp.]